RRKNKMAAMKNLALAAVLTLATGAALAQPMRCVDASGKVRYVDASQAGNDKCTPLENRLEIIPAPPNAPSRPQQPGGTGGQSREGAEGRLKDAEARLAAAKQALAEQEAVRYGDEKNYQRMLDRLKPYQDAVDNAQKDVDQARRDLR